MNATRRIRGQADMNPSEIAAKAQNLLCEINVLPADSPSRDRLLETLFGTWNGAVIRAPFQAEFGINIHFGEACFVDSGCSFHDQAAIRIGSFTQIASGVRILTANPDAPQDRPRPVSIGRNVWIGSNAVIRPGVTLGDDTIVSAGAVVTTDVPEGATVAGNPAKAIL